MQAGKFLREKSIASQDVHLLVSKCIIVTIFIIINLRWSCTLLKNFLKQPVSADGEQYLNRYLIITMRNVNSISRGFDAR
jgi:hypothetical protein